MSAAVVPTSSMIPVPFTITEVTRETHDCFTIELAPSEGEVVFRPGQFTMIYAFGRGEAPISISGDPRRRDRLVHTIRSVGNVTRALDALEAGDVVGIRGPFGNAWPLEQAQGRDLLVIAGGIGLAPLRPVVYEALADRARFDRVLVLYGTRSPQDILFDDELMAWRGRFDMDVEVIVDHGDDRWRGKTGVVTRLIERAYFAPDNAVAMICGPEVMMRFAARELLQQGVPLDRIYVSLERNMTCGVGQCGHCQLGPELICRDGPVYPYDRVHHLFRVREV